MKVARFGELATLVDLEIDDAPDRAERTHAVARALAASFPSADVVVAAGAVLIASESPARVPSDEAIRRVVDGVQADAGAPAPVTRRHTIAVVYDGSDLDDVAARLGLSRDDVIALHESREVTVELVGFLPGFGYLGPIDPRLVTARRPSPRPIVAAGSVGIAGAFTGVYPFASPGGWNLLGRAVGVTLFDPDRADPVLFRPGDRVRFERVRGEPTERAPAAPHAAEPDRGAPAEPALAVVEACPGVTIQDGGRVGRLAQGLPPSGPLDPVAFAAANAAVGNAPSAAAIEVPLGRLELAARDAVRLSIDGDGPLQVGSGERIVVPACERAVRYVAVHGGIAVPLVLGSRATLVVAKLGGFEGRMLRRGDVLPVGSVFGAPMPLATERAASHDGELVVDPGPDADRFPRGAFDALIGGAFRISRMGDRVGVRLEGARIPRDRDDRGLPRPMLRGAIQVATDGTPIVLGPDHPTTGGYPVLAILDRASCARLARLRPGSPVSFRSR